MKKLVSFFLVIMLLVVQPVFAEEIFTFEELTNIKAENVEKISIACSKGGRTEVVTDSPLIISKVVNSVKDTQFEKDTTAGGSAGGWLYFINFYMTDGTYIQYGARLYIDKVNYIATEHSVAIDKMAYYYDSIESIGSRELVMKYILHCTIKLLTLL